MDAESIQTLKSAGIGCGVFFLIILLIICWDTVEPTEWGLKYNSLSKNINSEDSIPSRLNHHSHVLLVYEGGRYLVSPFTSFVTFPRILKSIEFSNRVEALCNILNPTSLNIILQLAHSELELQKVLLLNFMLLFNIN
jgi:hypothetical protein